MNNRKILKLATHCAAIALLAGCAATTPEVAPEAAPVVEAAPPAVEAAPEPVALQPTPGLTTRERFQLAIELLQTGQAEQAGAELHAYTAEEANNQQALYLLSHIESPIEELFPAESFTVPVAAGETLSVIAGTYLGNVLGFYGLARYNNIENPSLVSEGQEIRVPSTPEALAAREAVLDPNALAATAGEATPAAPPAPQNVWGSIEAHVAAGRFEQAVAQAESNSFTPSAVQAAVLARAYDGNARALRETDTQRASALAWRAGELYLQTANRPEDAMNSLEFAAELNPGNGPTEALLANAKTQTADLYYRNGVAAFQRQDLAGAIAAYDRVLAIDPGHQNAQVNRLQAQQLQQNLQRLQ